MMRIVLLDSDCSSVRSISHPDASSRPSTMTRVGFFFSAPSELLVALVRHGKMSSRQALHRLRFQDDFSLGRSLPNLFDVADAKTQVAILETAEGIGDDEAKARALGSLSERLPEPRRTEVLDRALTAAEGIGDDEAKARALGSLAARLPEELLDRALTAAEEIGDDEAKAGALGTLAERLPEPRRAAVLERAVTAAGGDRGRLGQGRRARIAGRTLAGGTAGPRADGRRGDRGR